MSIVSINNLKEILRDFKSKVIDKATFEQTTNDLSNKINQIDTSTYMEKATYDSDNDSIIDKAKTLDGLNKTIEELNNIVLKSEIQTHTNKDVLDLLSSDGNELFFNGKSVHKLELPDGQINYTSTFMNVIANTDYGINIEKGSKLCDQIVQAWEFEEGRTDITTVAKTFNNHTNENFFYDNNIEFTDDVCKVKDEFVLNNTLNDTTGLYETKLNKSDFIELISLTSEVIE